VFEPVDGEPFADLPALNGPDVAPEMTGDRLPAIQPVTQVTFRLPVPGWAADRVAGLLLHDAGILPPLPDVRR
jgi:hypothetical protein